MIHRLLRHMQQNDPLMLPRGLRKTALAPGVLLDTQGTRADRGSRWETAPGTRHAYVFVTSAQRANGQTVRYEWQLQAPDGAGTAYCLIPPDFADARGTMNPAHVRASTKSVFTALSRLMYPGLPVPRQVVIQDDTLDINVADAISETVAACQGMGLGTVSMPTYERSWELGTSAPMFIGAHLLVDPAAHQQLARAMLYYMVGVMTRGAPPFQFHLCAFQDPDAEDLRMTVSDRDVRHLLRTLARDVRLAQGNGRLGVVTALGGALATLAGGMALVVHHVHNGPIGLDTTPTAFWTVVGGVVAACGGGALVALENHHSTQPPAMTTPFQLHVWPDPDRPSPSPFTLNRVQQGRAMRTVT